MRAEILREQHQDNPQPLSPKPHTLDPKPQTPNPTPLILNHKSESLTQVPIVIRNVYGEVLPFQITLDVTQGHQSISYKSHPILLAFVRELTEETINLPLGCLQGGDPKLETSTTSNNTPTVSGLNLPPSTLRPSELQALNAEP